MAKIVGTGRRLGQAMRMRRHTTRVGGAGGGDAVVIRNPRICVAASTPADAGGVPPSGDSDATQEREEDKDKEREALSEQDKEKTDGSPTPTSQQARQKPSLLQRVLGPDPKQKLKALGSGALLSYGCVSNIFYVTGVHVAYYAGARQTGISPLFDATSRGTFFTVYAGLFALNNIPAFERLRRAVANRFSMGPKASFICVVTLVNVVGTFAYLFSGVAAVSLILRVPLVPA